MESTYWSYWLVDFFFFKKKIGETYRSGHRLVGFLAAVWCLTTFVFVNSYNSTLASYLSVSYNAPEVNSIEDLASSSSNQLVILKGSISEVDILVNLSFLHRLVQPSNSVNLEIRVRSI
jgi:Ligand-gated ion channel